MIDFAPLLELPCREYVRIALKTGEAESVILNEIEKCGGVPGATRDDLALMVREYADSIGVMIRPPKPVNGRYYDDGSRSVEVDEVETLNRLIALQVSRLETQAAQETVQGFPFKTFGLELDVAAKAVKTLAQVKGILGKINPATDPAVAQQEALAKIVERYGTTAANILKNPATRRKMIGVIENLHVLSPKLGALSSGSDDSDA